MSDVIQTAYTYLVIVLMLALVGIGAAVAIQVVQKKLSSVGTVL